MISRRLALLGLLLLLAMPASAQDEDPSTQTETITKVATTSAQFLKLGYGARPIALGGSFVAQADDLSALYWNVAGLARMRGTAVQFSTTEYLVDVQYSAAAFGINMGNVGTLAASLIYLDSGEMAVRTVERPDGTGEQFDVQSFALQLSYARNLTDRFSIGGSAKYVRETIWHSSASTIAFDVGTLFTTPYERLRLGASFSNFGSKMQMNGRDIKFSNDPLPDASGGVEIVNANYEMEETSLPLLFRVGIAWDAVLTADHRVVVSTDAAHPNDNTEYVNLGAEYVFRDLIALRAGQRHLFEEDGVMGLTFGGGLNIRIDRALRARVDYAYTDFNRLGNTHWFTVDLAF